MRDGSADDDVVPVSVRLGEVVPPEGPEDWTRPLTWIAAVGMLVGPLVALAWFVVARPADRDAAFPATYLVAASLAGGAAATGATQIGAVRAFAATLASGLFGALAVVLLGVVMAGERQVGVASPTLAHAFASAAGGAVGALDGALLAAVTARVGSRLVRLVPSLVSGGVIAVAVVALLMGVR